MCLRQLAWPDPEVWVCCTHCFRSSAQGHWLHQGRRRQAPCPGPGARHLGAASRLRIPCSGFAHASKPVQGSLPGLLVDHDDHKISLTRVEQWRRISGMTEASTRTSKARSIETANCFPSVAIVFRAIRWHCRQRMPLSSSCHHRIHPPGKYKPIYGLSIPAMPVGSPLHLLSSRRMAPSFAGRRGASTDPGLQASAWSSPVLAPFHGEDVCLHNHQPGMKTMKSATCSSLSELYIVRDGGTIALD